MKMLIIAAGGLALAGAAQAQNEMTMDSHALSTAIGGYPACSADVQDSCVQAREAGLASAAGGPFEPVEQHAQANAMAAYQGMGGPIEDESYPPCQPGEGDDRCIQLYERGVSR